MKFTTGKSGLPIAGRVVAVGMFNHATSVQQADDDNDTQ